jgi:hypothetical protein
MPEKLVTVASSSVPLEAELAKNRLELNGIFSYLADEDTVSLWNLGSALGSVKLQVAIGNEARARAILATPPEDADSSSPLPAVGLGDELAREWTCPGCGLRVGGDFASCPACGSGWEAIPEQLGSIPAEDETEVVSIGDALANRAYRAAILGYLICFPFLQVYSAILLVRLAGYEGDLSPRSTRRMLIALVLDWTALLLVVLLYFWLRAWI